MTSLSTGSSQQTPRLLRLPAVLAERGIGRTRHYGDIEDGLFPPPLKWSPKLSVWPSNEVEAINAARIAGKSEDEIRSIVKQLVAGRQRAFDNFASAISERSAA